MESNGLFYAKNVKNEGFLKKSQKSSWISTISKIRHYGSKTDVLGDILSPYPFLDQIWTTFRKMDFFDFFGFSNILCYFPLLFWGPKMSKYDFLLWPSNGVLNLLTWYFWTNFYYGSTRLRSIMRYGRTKLLFLFQR